MAYFPLYIDIEGQPCTVVGGGNIAAGKVRCLLEFGAAVTVIAPEVTAELRLLAEAGRIVLREESFVPGNWEDCMAPTGERQKEGRTAAAAQEQLAQIEGSTLVVAATDDAAVNASVSRFCKKRHIPVNVVDEKELCSFYFPSIVKRGDVVAAISTGGSSPALAARLRRELETQIPDSYGRAAKQLGACREYVHEQVTDAGQRKRVFEELLACALDREEADSAEDMLSREIIDRVIAQVVEDSQS